MKAYRKRPSPLAALAFLAIFAAAAASAAWHWEAGGGRYLYEFIAFLAVLLVVVLFSGGTWLTERRNAGVPAVELRESSLAFRKSGSGRVMEIGYGEIGSIEMTLIPGYKTHARALLIRRPGKRDLYIDDGLTVELAEIKAAVDVRLNQPGS